MRTRMSGGVGAGRAILPATRLELRAIEESSVRCVDSVVTVYGDGASQILKVILCARCCRGQLCLIWMIDRRHIFSLQLTVQDQYFPVALFYGVLKRLIATGLGDLSISTDAELPHILVEPSHRSTFEFPV